MYTPSHVVSCAQAGESHTYSLDPPLRKLEASRGSVFLAAPAGWGVFLASPGGRRQKKIRVRFKIDGEVVNFIVYYEIDDNDSRHVLTREGYGGEGVGSWVLLEATVE